MKTVHHISTGRLALPLITCILLLTSSCSGLKYAALKSARDPGNCNQQNAYTYTVNDLPKPIYEIELDTCLTNRFSPKSLNMANAIGVLEYLEKYVRAKKESIENPSTEKRLELIELALKINQRINISSIEISAVTSEIDCEEERADQIGNYLEGKESQTESRLTVGTIIVGAAGTIVTGALIADEKSGNTGDIIGIGTSLIEATLGILILVNKRSIEFLHPRNILREVWEGKETSPVFPTFVWYYLNYFNPSDFGTKSIRDQIIAHWMDFGQISNASTKERTKLIDIYFGSGGKYSAEQLKNRSNMLDQLEAQISLMKQEIKGLAIEVESLE